MKSIDFTKIFYSRFLILYTALLLVLAQVGCATGYTGSTVSHGFEFNAWRDSPDIEVIAYRYGNPVDTIGGRIVRTAQDTKDGKTSKVSLSLAPKCPLAKSCMSSGESKLRGKC